MNARVLTGARLWALALAGVAVFWSMGVSAQSAGALYGVVFEQQGGAPLQGVPVTVADQQEETDADGAFRLILPPGAHKVRLGSGAEVSVMIFSGQQTLVLVSLAEDGALGRVELETPTEEAAQASASDPRGDEHLPSGRVLGRLENAETGAPVVGARVLVRGLKANSSTDEEGRFVLDLPVGLHDLTAIHPSFSTLVLPEVNVMVDADTQLNAEMTPSGVELEDFVVVAPRIEGSALDVIDERRTSAAVNDIIGADQMSRSGDSDAASALKRVTGVTVVGGRYAYVRGLGDRYSMTLLDGAVLPSPEPERRVVPLDLFPASALESILIQKTYTPDMPGEFGGGVVVLRTRGFPAGFEGKAGVSGTWRTRTTLVPSLRDPGGPWDFLGIDGGTRALPDAVARASNGEQLSERDRFSSRGYTAEQLEAFGEQMNNVWTPQRFSAPPGLGLSFEVGDFGTLGGKPAGYLLALGYDNAWARTAPRATFYKLSDDELSFQHGYKFENLTNTVTLSGLLSAGIDLSPDHRLRWAFFMTRITDNEARRYNGFNSDVGTIIDVTRLRWVERTLLHQHLHGEHDFERPGAEDWSLQWHYSYALAVRDEPDRREVRYDLEENTGEHLLSDRPEGNQRVFSLLVDHNHDLGVDVTWPMRLLGDGEQLKFGASMIHKSREVDTRRYKFLHKGPISGDSEIISQRPEDIFVADNIDGQGFQFGEITRPTDNYSATQLIMAGYAMAQLSPWEALTVLGGLRVEGSDQEVKTFELFNPESTPELASLQTFDLLPALTATWDLGESMKLRAAASRTVTRPDFRELSPATFNDVTGGRQIFGNKDLKRGTILHQDLRWEWYPRAGESMSISLFAKQFQDPIEKTVEVAAQHTITYTNALGASNLGLELELYKRLDFIHEALLDLYASGNLTLVHSRIELDESSGIQTSNTRPLQGQAPYVLNLQLGVDNPDSGLRAAALYHITGPRISDVGALGAPDIIEEPVAVVDLVLSQRFGDGVKLSLKAKNLLDEPVRFTQGNRVTQVERRGRSFSAALSWAF